MKNSLTYDFAKKFFKYDPATGVFLKQDSRNGLWVNACFYYKNRDQLLVRIGNNRYNAARIIHLWMTGQYPEGKLMSLNKDVQDTRWCNIGPYGGNSRTFKKRDESPVSVLYNRFVFGHYYPNPWSQFA